MSLSFENGHDHRPGFPSSLTSSCQRKKTKETLILSVFVLVSRRTNALSVTPFLFCPTFLLPISAYTRRFDLFDFMISMWLSLLSPRFQASGSYLWSLLCIHAALLADIVTNKAIRVLFFICHSCFTCIQNLIIYIHCYNCDTSPQQTPCECFSTST